MARVLLPREAAKVQQSLKKELDADSTQNCTVGNDGWTNQNKRSVYATTVTIPGPKRRTFLLKAADASEKNHNAPYLASKSLQISTSTWSLTADSTGHRDTSTGSLQF